MASAALPQPPSEGLDATGDGACLRLLYLDSLGNPHTSVTYTTQSAADLIARGAEVRQALDLMHSALGLELLSVTVGTLAGERLLPEHAAPPRAELRLVHASGVRSAASPDTAG